MAPYQTADLPRMFSTRTNDLLRRSIWIEMYLNRGWESELQSNYATKIPQMAENQTATDMTRDGDWKTPEDIAVTEQEFAVDKSKETGVKIRRKDQLESQLNLVARQVDINAYIMAKAIQVDLFQVLRDGVKASQVEAKSTTAAEYLTGASKVADSTVFKAIGARVEGMVLDMATDGWVGTDAAVQQAPVVLTHPYVIAAALNYFADAEKLAEVQMPGAFARGSINATGMYAFYYRGALFRGTTLATPPATGANSDSYPMFGFLPNRYVTYARRPTLSVMFTPETNQTGPRFRLHQVVDYGRKVLNSADARASWIRKEA